MDTHQAPTPETPGVVIGNHTQKYTARTSATWETKRTKPRLDQWLRCPGVLPRSRT